MRPIIMRCELTSRLGRTRPAQVRSRGSETLLRIRSLAGYTIDMHESKISEATSKPNKSPKAKKKAPRRWGIAGEEVATASVLATAAKAAAPRVSVTWSVLVGIVLATRAHARGRDPIV